MLRRTLVLAGYIVAGLSIVLITVALVAYGKGYSYDFKNNRFVLNGLVLLETIPDRAKVFIDGEEARQETPFRSTMEAGSYNFEVIKDGYRSWRKTLAVNASEVTFAEYVILFPEEIKTENFEFGHGAAGLTASPDRKRLAYIGQGRAAGVWLVDPDKKENFRIYSAKPASGRVKAEAISSLTWSPDNSRILMKSSYNGKTNFTVLQVRGNSDPLNLSDLFNQDFRQIQFNPANNDELYWTSPQGNLHRLNLNDRTASAILAEKVSSFSFGGGRVFYVQSTRLGKTLFSLERSGFKQELIQSLAESSSYDILFSRFEDRDYLVVVPSAAKTATLYSEIFTDHPQAKVIARDVDHLRRSPSSRFLVAYNSDTVTTFDLKKKTHHDFGRAVTGIKNLEWFDEFHLLVTGAGSNVVEFDGANIVALGKSLSGSAYASPDRKEILGLNAKQTGLNYQIVRP